MLNGTILDVAVGLILVFLMLSVACSLLTERIHSVLDTRAKMLEGALLKLLGKEPGSPFDGVKRHALVSAISHPRIGMPSYIPSSTFTQALFDTLVPDGREYQLTVKRLRDAITQLPTTSRAALLVLVNAAEDDVAAARTHIEHWFDNAMERLSGAYKRHVTIWIFGLGFVLAAATNADSILLVQRLEHENALRATVTAQASEIDTAGQKLPLDQEQIDRMALLFWDTDHVVTAEQTARYPRALRQPEWSLSWARWLVFKIFGFLMTSMAVSLGAPFWFDLLGRFVNLRAAGAKPPTASKPVAASP